MAKILIPNDDATAAAAWWGTGGAELVDAIDPGCCSEAGVGVVVRLTTEQAVKWRKKARAIPGFEHTGIEVLL